MHTRKGRGTTSARHGRVPSRCSSWAIRAPSAEVRTLDPDAPHRSDRASLLAWCDYLVCDPISCPQDLSGPERWRSLRTVRGNVAAGSSTLSVDTPLDLGADIDPEDGSNDWI